MILLLPLILLGFASPNTHLLELLTGLGMPLHKICLARFDQISEWSLAYQALVCGKPLPQQAPLLLNSQTLGLYHLLVVSGAHFVFIERWINYILRRQWRGLGPLILVLLTIYCLACLWQPPCVRALMGSALCGFSRRCKLFWTPPQTAFLAGMICLSLFPEWWDSTSLILSWTGALALNWGQGAELKTNIYSYLILYIPLLNLICPHPISILANSVLAPAFGLLLLPLSLASGLVPITHWIVDPLWRGLDQLLEVLRVLAPPAPAVSPRIPLLGLWTYLLGIQILSCALLKTRPLEHP